MKRKDVIKIKVDDIISIEEKKEIYNFANFFVSSNNYYSRQGGSIEDKIEKAYRGFISEKILENIILNINSNLGNNIIFDGLLNYNSNQKTDKYDIMINGYTIDVKSSKETKKKGEYYNSYLNKDYGEDYIEYALDNRNYILPEDQSVKDFIIQIMYDYNDEYVYIFGIISGEGLKNEKTANLKVSFDKYQKTHMMKLKKGISLLEFLKEVSKHNK